MSEKLQLITCLCGKKFYPAPEHVYKIRGKKVCSWTCMRKAEKEGKTYE